MRENTRKHTKLPEELIKLLNWVFWVVLSNVSEWLTITLLRGAKILPNPIHGTQGEAQTCYVLQKWM